jgi:hypothetical protein
MTGEAALLLLDRGVGIGLGEFLALVAGETEFLSFGLEKLRVRRVVHFVATTAFSFHHRLVHRFFGIHCLEQGVAGQTESRGFRAHHKCPNHTMRKMTGFTILSLNRGVDIPLLILGYHVRMTLGTGLADFSGRL